MTLSFFGGKEAVETTPQMTPLTTPTKVQSRPSTAGLATDLRSGVGRWRVPASHRGNDVGLCCVMRHGGLQVVGKSRVGRCGTRPLAVDTAAE